MSAENVIPFNNGLAARIAHFAAIRERQALLSVGDARCLSIANWVRDNYKFGPGVITKVWQGWKRTQLHDAVELSQPISLSILNISDPVLAHLVVKIDAAGKPIEAVVVTLMRGNQQETYGSSPDLSGFDAGIDVPSIFPTSEKVRVTDDMRDYADWTLLQKAPGDRRLTRWYICERADSVTFMTPMKSKAGESYCFELVFDEQGEPFATFKSIRPMKGSFTCFDPDLNPLTMGEFKTQRNPSLAEGDGSHPSIRFRIV